MIAVQITTSATVHLAFHPWSDSLILAAAVCCQLTQLLFNLYWAVSIVMRGSQPFGCTIVVLRGQDKGGRLGLWHIDRDSVPPPAPQPASSAAARTKRASAQMQGVPLLR